MVLKLSSIGSAVKLLQTQLNQAGYSLKPDGIFGIVTLRAVRDFQAQCGIVVDGKAGQQTMARLGEVIMQPIKTPKTANFGYAEFASSHDKWAGGAIPAQYYGNLQTLMQRLEMVRKKVGHPIVIQSGYRSPKYNKAVGGAKKSQHLYAKAADIYVARHAISTYRLATIIYDDLALRMLFGGLGLGSKNNVHVDTRMAKNKQKPATWWYSSKTWQEWSRA